MVSMTRSTSITSISGVVLMSIITSGSFALIPLPGPTFIAIAIFPTNIYVNSCSTAARRRLRNEAYLRNPGALARIDDTTDTIVVRVAIAANLHFRLRRQHGDLF